MVASIAPRVLKGNPPVSLIIYIYIAVYIYMNEQYSWWMMNLLDIFMWMNFFATDIYVCFSA
jgi:hypothetical protein